MALNINQLENYPRLLRVKDIQFLLNLGRDSTYQVVNTPGFPKMVICGIILVHPVALKKWLDQNQTSSFK